MTTLPALIPFANNGASVLPPRQVMSGGQYLRSPTQKYALVLQEQGDLVIVEMATGGVIWVARADQPYTSTLAYRGGGLSFYVSNSAFLNDPFYQRQWVATSGLTDTALWYRSHLTIQDDGNMLILDVQAIYSSNTSAALYPNASDVRVIGPGMSLDVNRFYTIGEYSLVFLDNGNLAVLDTAMNVVWHAGVNGQGGTQATMQTDGNFVITARDGRVIWSTGTAGHPGAYAQIQANGAFVICYGVTIWARFGWTPTIRGRTVFYPDHTDPIENSTDPFPTYGHIGYEF